MQEGSDRVEAREMRLRSAFVVVALSGTASAFTVAPRGAPMMSLNKPQSPKVELSRTDLLQGAFIAGTALLGMPSSSFALNIPSGPSKAEMLEKTRGKKTEEEIKADKERLAEIRKERLRLAREQAAEEEARKNDPNRKDVEIDPDLRAAYYFPTARKRYLPRIKLVSDSLGDAKTLVGRGDWAQLEKFANKEADDCTLPMKLYASSLDGQGLSLAVSYVKVMQDSADAYAKQLEAFKKAVKGKDKDKAVAALGNMEAAILTYRKAGRIDAPDFGIGEFASDKKLGAAFGNNNPTLYKKNFKLE